MIKNNVEREREGGRKREQKPGKKGKQNKEEKLEKLMRSETKSNTQKRPPPIHSLSHCKPSPRSPAHTMFTIIHTVCLHKMTTTKT